MCALGFCGCFGRGLLRGFCRLFRRITLDAGDILVEIKFRLLYGTFAIKQIGVDLRADIFKHLEKFTHIRVFSVDIRHTRRTEVQHPAFVRGLTADDRQYFALQSIGHLDAADEYFVEAFPEIVTVKVDNNPFDAAYFLEVAQHSHVRFEPLQRMDQIFMAERTFVYCVLVCYGRRAV